MVINGDLLGTYENYVTGVMQAFLPLVLLIVSVFITFAVANSLRFYISKMIK